MIGPGGGGWIQSIIFDPIDDQTLYIGCDVGGFYYSRDLGTNYEIRNKGLRDYFIQSIAVHPKDNRIIIVGTQSGIHRTADQGKTWQWIRTGFPNAQQYSFSSPISAVVIDILQPNIVYAGIGRPRFGKDGQGAIYRSQDTGVTWLNISRGQIPSDALVNDIKLKPGSSTVILTATNKGIYRSDDAGKTWKTSIKGLPHLYIEKISFASSAPNVVYCSLRATARDSQLWNGGVYRSIDGGLSWENVNGKGLPMFVGRSDFSSYRTSNIKEISVDPENENIVYVGNQDWLTPGIHITTDGGKTWRLLTHSLSRIRDQNYGWIRQWGPNVETLAVSPVRKNLLAFGTPGHVFFSNDGGESWQQRYTKMLSNGKFTSTGLEVTCLFNIIPDPMRPGRIYLCYADIGLLISNDNGKTFTGNFKGIESNGHCYAVVIDPQLPSTLWVAMGPGDKTSGGVYRSDDDAKTWQRSDSKTSDLPSGHIRHLLLDSKSSIGKRRLLATIEGYGAFESLDGGKIWHCINGNLPSIGAKLPRGLLLDPTNSAHIIIALGGIPNAGAGVYETVNGGATWQCLNTEPIFADVTNLSCDPHDFQKIYIGTREYFDHASKHIYPGGAFKSMDGGKSWKQVFSYHFVSAIALSPVDSKTIYIGTTDHPYHDNNVAAGILKSNDGGLTWEQENVGLTNWNVNSITISSHNPSILFIGTGGNGAFVGKDKNFSSSEYHND